jgi:hypothetical protein
MELSRKIVEKKVKTVIKKFGCDQCKKLLFTTIDDEMDANLDNDCSFSIKIMPNFASASTSLFYVKKQLCKKCMTKRYKAVIKALTENDFIENKEYNSRI